MLFEELYGYYLLVEEGLNIHNSKYVKRYGRFMWCLKKLDRDKSRSNYAFLKSSYSRSMREAKFCATYHMDLSKLSLSELRKLIRENEVHK